MADFAGGNGSVISFLFCNFFFDKELVSLEILNDQNIVSWRMLALVILLEKTQMQTIMTERNVTEDANTNNTDTQIQIGSTQI